MIRCTDFRSLTADEFGDYEESPPPTLQPVAKVFWDSLALHRFLLGLAMREM